MGGVSKDLEDGALGGLGCEGSLQGLGDEGSMQGEDVGWETAESFLYAVENTNNAKLVQTQIQTSYCLLV